MRVNVAIPEAHVAAPVLDAALEATTRLNESLLQARQIPDFEKQLRAGLKWQPEPPGQEHFDHGGILAKRGWGDCDDLAPLHAATLRHNGEDPHATAVVRRSGPKTWHAVVLRGDGSIDDPSKRAGMGRPHEYHGAVLPVMNAPRAGVHGAFIVRPQIALRPLGKGFQARADIPWHHWDENDKPSASDYAMASLHQAPVAATALTGAIEGAVELGLVAGFATDEHIGRLMCIHGVLQGADPDELAEIYGEQEVGACEQIVGSFFSHFNPIHALSHLAQTALHNPLTSMAANFIPGGRAALDVANMIPGFGGGGGGGGGGGAPMNFFPGQTPPGFGGGLQRPPQMPFNLHCQPFG